MLIKRAHGGFHGLMEHQVRAGRDLFFSVRQARGVGGRVGAPPLVDTSLLYMHFEHFESLYKSREWADGADVRGARCEVLGVENPQTRASLLVPRLDGRGHLPPTKTAKRLKHRQHSIVYTVHNTQPTHPSLSCSARFGRPARASSRGRTPREAPSR